MSQHDTLTLRDALRNIQYEAASLADAQVIALQALNATYPARAALSATQPAQAAQGAPAEHWHRLYLEKCQQYNDRVAQLGGVIEGLEAEQAEQAGKVEATHWTEREPVRLAASRVGRVYIAGPMTGIEDFNFPAFNAEAAALREQGLSVLNPAEHGIVEGAEWADYLRHDIAGLASCERIHLLRGWSNSKGARLEVTIAQALGMQITFQDGAEQVPAHPAPQPAAGADVLDAGRYRWLRTALADRSNQGKSHWFCSIPEGAPSELDSAIDAAIAASGRQE